MNPLAMVLRRLSVPNLSAYGLPAPPGDGFTQFLRSHTVPILDHGFVAAVRSGRIKVVPPVESVRGHQLHMVGGTVLQPDDIIAATGYRPDMEQLVGDLGVLDESGFPKVHGAQTMPGAPGLTSWASASNSRGFSMKLPAKPVPSRAESPRPPPDVRHFSHTK